MTLLVASLAVDTVKHLDPRAQRAWAGGADAVELRIDAMTEDPGALAAYLRAHQERTWIVTCRGVAEGGDSRETAQQRVERLWNATEGTDVYVDFEAAEWSSVGTSSELRQRLTDTSGVSDRTGCRLILSSHDFTGKPTQLHELDDRTVSTAKACCMKTAYHVNDINDTFAALDWMHGGALGNPTDPSRRVGRVAIAMGEAGSWTRLLAKKFGAFASYAALDQDVATAPGQLTLDEMVHRYRWKSIDEATRVFGVIGDPIAHSMSPLIFNRWFEDGGVNAVYVPLRVGGGDDGLRRFLDGCRQRPWLDIGGFSVTVPHKMEALKWVGDGADYAAQCIGALNTLVFRDNVTGFNTDSHAAASSMIDALECSRMDLSDMDVDVLGTGGAARAVLRGLFGLGCRMTVYGRSETRARQMAEPYRAAAASWDERAGSSGDVLINCTSVGMWPDVDDSPMPSTALNGRRLVFDLIYNPLQTRLLRDAAAAGVATLNGLDMFIRQAAMQYELWIGTSPDTKVARELVEGELSRESDNR